MAGSSKISQMTGAMRNGATNGTSAIAEPDEELDAETDEDNAEMVAYSHPGYNAYPAAVEPSRTYDEVMSLLEAPLDTSLLKEREGYGTENGRKKMLQYLEWHTVVRQLNRIFGFGNWDTSVSEIVDMKSDPETGVPMGVRATVRLEVHLPHEENHRTYVEYENVGFSVTNRGKQYRDGKTVFKPYTWEAYEMAVKGAVHDALKRAAVNLGEQFGLSLYVKEEEVKQTHSSSATEESGTTTSSSSTATATTTTDTGEVACEVFGCENTVHGYTSKGGKTYTTAQLVNYSKKDCDGHVYCYDHKNQYKDGWRPDSD